MKILKKEYDKHLNYFKKINKQKLKNLDLTDFNIKYNEEQIKEWYFTGLTNKDYIRSMRKDKNKY